MPAGPILLAAAIAGYSTLAAGDGVPARRHGAQLVGYPYRKRRGRYGVVRGGHDAVLPYRPQRKLAGKYFSPKVRTGRK